MTKKKAYGIMAFAAICCVVMAFIETVVEPAYPVKSAMKVAVFLLLPLIIAKAAGIRLFDGSFELDRKSVVSLLALGLVIYGGIIGAYALTQNLFDYGSLVQALSADQKVGNGSFWGVAFYISFCNSFLEEFIFRLVAFLELSKHAAKRTAYAFSSVLFALYHVAMIGTSFPPLLMALCLMGLAAGGLIFDYLDGRKGNLYSSWVVHMFADFAIMTIWYLHL